MPEYNEYASLVLLSHSILSVPSPALRIIRDHLWVEKNGRIRLFSDQRLMTFTFWLQEKNGERCCDEDSERAPKECSFAASPH
jgi:hypothetical protein